MDKAKVLYELENGVILRDGDEVIVTTNDEGEFPEGEYRGRIKVTPDAIWILGETSTKVDSHAECIDFEFIENVQKL